MQLSQDLLLYIGQNYLKNTQHIKKLFYHNEDNKLQELLFGEVLYKHKQFPKTTIPLDCVLEPPNQMMILNGIVEEFLDLAYELYKKGIDYEYQVLVTFEIINDVPTVEVEYVVKRNNHEPTIYCIDKLVSVIDDEYINKRVPGIYKRLEQLVLKKFIN